MIHLIYVGPTCWCFRGPTQYINIGLPSIFQFWITVERYTTHHLLGEQCNSLALNPSPSFAIQAHNPWVATSIDCFSFNHTPLVLRG